MANEPARPATPPPAASPAPIMSVPPGQKAAVVTKADEQTVRVRALGILHKEAGLQGETTRPDEEFETTRARAVELRAHGLVEYVSESDGRTIHGEAEDKRLSDLTKAEREQGRLRPQDKSGPLRNPKLPGQE